MLIKTKGIPYTLPHELNREESLCVDVYNQITALIHKYGNSNNFVKFTNPSSQDKEKTNLDKLLISVAQHLFTNDILKENFLSYIRNQILNIIYVNTELTIS